MRPLSILLIILTLSIGVFGTITMSANKVKKTRLSTAYFQKSTGVYSISASAPVFDDANITNQATVKLNNCTDALLWKNADLTGPVKFVP